MVYFVRCGLKYSADRLCTESRTGSSLPRQRGSLGIVYGKRTPSNGSAPKRASPVSGKWWLQQLSVAFLTLLMFGDLLPISLGFPSFLTCSTDEWSYQPGHTWSTQFLFTLDFVSKSVPSPVSHTLMHDASQPNQVALSTHIFDQK